MHPELNKNIPGNPDWIGSFYETLTEYGEWDSEKYQILLNALKELSENNKEQKTIDRELTKTLLILQAKVLNLISSHFDENDIYKISNLNTDEILDKKEEFELTVLSIVS